MNDEAESSRAAFRYNGDNSGTDTDPERDTVADDEETAARRAQTVKERRLEAKKKRLSHLDSLLRHLDTLVHVELITVYHLDCSFFWFIIRTILHVTLLTPLPDFAISRQHDEHKAFLPTIVCSFALNFFLHLIRSAPSAGEDTRGYLHGGLMIDFIGQQGPTSKWKLAALDVCVLVLQLVMVSVYVKRRDMKKKLAKVAGGVSATGSTESRPSDTEGETANGATNADRDQDADSEERGVLRADTLSDIGAEADEEDLLLPLPSGVGHADALDVLASGQCLIGDFHVIDTLLQEHENYNTRSESRAGRTFSPAALRQLHTIRVRFGVGG
ncbi:DUF1746-domain-containing protein [Lojkania enalia]|uniref:DUF1746-domain-containing protein n=1 Tax=Lojkania enalia TaxID=147567 RepID=A0A9P4K7V6_9PLEO|nr:DUF1746-domain-containing protein [Didymosphaeria enalia]